MYGDGSFHPLITYGFQIAFLNVLPWGGDERVQRERGFRFGTIAMGHDRLRGTEMEMEQGDEWLLEEHHEDGLIVYDTRWEVYKLELIGEKDRALELSDAAA